MLYFKSKEIKGDRYMKSDKLIATAKISSQGQITLPKAVREKLCLESGDMLIFTLNNKEEIKIENPNNLENLNNKKNGDKNGK